MTFNKRYGTFSIVYQPIEEDTPMTVTISDTEGDDVLYIPGAVDGLLRQFRNHEELIINDNGTITVIPFYSILTATYVATVSPVEVGDAVCGEAPIDDSQGA